MTTLVWGHRGTRARAGDELPKPPENTLAAMRWALARGAHGIELDVRLCKSGEVVVLHDEGLERVAGVALRAQDATLAELQAHDLGGGERVPTLRAAIDTVLGQGEAARLNIELKADVPDQAALVEAVARELDARPEREHARTLMSSFSASICAAMGRRAPGVAVAFLYEHEQDAAARPAGVSIVHPKHTLLDPGRIAQLHARHLLVNTWTVNDPERARLLAAAGVDGIITDDVPAIVSALAGL